jgi:CDP-glycerol glycerophosphotransferase (TagB/SpsB family)
MTTTPTLARGRPRLPELSLDELAWRRVQVLLRVHPADALPDPGALRLRHRSVHATMAPTGWVIDGDDLTVRFNVMQGPGQQPLAAGRWILETTERGPRGGVHRRPLPLRLPGASSLPGRRFELVDRTIAVRPFVEGTPSRLGLEVRLEAGARGRATPPPGPLRRLSVWIGIQVFRALYGLSRRAMPRNGHRILFTSDSRPELGGNLKLVYDRMVERGLDRDHQLLTMFRPGIATRRSVLDRLRLPWRLAIADTIVIDDFQPVIQHLDAGDARIVQLWHAVGAFKTVGYSRVGKPGAPDPYGRVHKNYSLAIVSSRDDIPTYAEAFGIPEARVVPTGIPRVDPMFDPAHRTEALAQMRQLFPATQGRHTYLFAPTFRGYGARTATYDTGRIDWERLHAMCVEKDAVCIIRMHPFVRDPVVVPDALRDRLLDGSTTAIEPNDLLFAVDLLITDYSSIVYEYSTLNRPMLFYAYDLEDYVSSRDFYEPYETFVPGRIVRTFDELLDAIRREDFEVEKVEAFARRHFDHLDGDSTDRVIDLITAP